MYKRHLRKTDKIKKNIVVEITIKRQMLALLPQFNTTPFLAALSSSRSLVVGPLVGWSVGQFVCWSVGHVFKNVTFRVSKGN